VRAWNWCAHGGRDDRYASPSIAIAFAAAVLPTLCALLPQLHSIDRSHQLQEDDKDAVEGRRKRRCSSATHCFVSAPSIAPEYRNAVCPRYLRRRLIALIHFTRFCLFRSRQMAHFGLPLILDHSGWGPVPAAASAPASTSSSSVDQTESKEAGNVAAYQPVPAGAFMFAELPFQPFNKNDKLWRVSDWATKEGGQ
jgi:hypothetical protein